MRRAHWLSVVLLACSGGDKAETPPADDPVDADTDADADSDVDADTDTDSDVDPVEACDGIDNDGDGLVDENFEDFDEDDVADCVDDDCELVELPLAVALVPLPCTTPFEAVVGYSLSTPSLVGPGLRAGRLVDHDGNGQVDALDGLTLVEPAAGGMEYFDAVTGVRDLTVPGQFRSHVGVLADLDGDGENEALGVVLSNPADDGWSLRAYDRAGTELWSSTEREAWYPNDLTVADLDGDGIAEVISPPWVFDGTTGAERFELAGSRGFGLATVGDLDLDGSLEIVAAGQVFDATGALLWEGAYDPEYWVHPVLAQLDDDPEAEVVFANGEARADAFEADGTPIAAWDASGDVTGIFDFPNARPCVVDVDGDGLAEVAIPFTYDLVLFNHDGTVRWNYPQSFFSFGCSAFDFDVDGLPEIVALDGGYLAILDGSTGDERLVDGSLQPVSLGLGPMVLDVDGDGAAELVLSGIDPLGGGYLIHVMEHPAGAWPGAGSAWGVGDFAEGRVSEEGVVGTPPFWLDDGFMVRTPTTEPPSILVDGGVELGAELIDACAASCSEGPQKFMVQISNHGGLVAPAGIPVDLLSRAPDEAVIGTAVLGEIQSGGFEMVTFVVEDPIDTAGNNLFVRIDSPYPTCFRDHLESGFREDQCL